MEQWTIYSIQNESLSKCSRITDGSSTSHKSFFISRTIFFLLITSIPIFILRAVCTHTRGCYCTHDICIFFIKCLIFIFTTYLINFLIYLFIIYFYFTLTFLRWWNDHIIALIVLHVLYFSYFLIVFYVYIYIYIYIYGRRLVWNKL